MIKLILTIPQEELTMFLKVPYSAAEGDTAFQTQKKE